MSTLRRTKRRPGEYACLGVGEIEARFRAPDAAFKPVYTVRQ
jgi:hypothetical protein